MTDQTATAIRHRTGWPWYAAIARNADFSHAGLRPMEIVWQSWDPCQTWKEAIEAAIAELKRRRQAESTVKP